MDKLLDSIIATGICGALILAILGLIYIVFCVILGMDVDDI